MKKEIRVVTDTCVQVTTADERWYSRQGVNAVSGLPEIQWVPSVTWIASHYPKGIGFYKWLADKGWDVGQVRGPSGGDAMTPERMGERARALWLELLTGKDEESGLPYMGLALDDTGAGIDYDESSIIRLFSRALSTVQQEAWEEAAKAVESHHPWSRADLAAQFRDRAAASSPKGSA